MKGTQPSTPSAPAPTSPYQRRRFLLVIAVAAVIVVASLSVYVLTRPLPIIRLTVSDGSISKGLEATFADYTDTAHPIFRIYAATTTTNESDGTTSTLTLKLFLGAYYRPSAQSVDLGLFPVVSGRFAPDLAPTQLTLALNQTGRTAWAWGYAYPTAFNNSLPWATVAFPGPTNVTVDPTYLPQVGGTGSTSMSTALVNQSTKRPSFEFLWPAFIEEADSLGDNAFFEVRATVTGPFTPAVSVGILVHLIDIPVTYTGFYAAIERSADGSRWVLDVTDPGIGYIYPNGYPNATTDLQVLNLDGATVVPATPLGDIYRSTVNSSVAYVPATSGSSVIGIGDLITLSVSLYSYDYLVQLVSGNVVLYQATLG